MAKYPFIILFLLVILTVQNAVAVELPPCDPDAVAIGEQTPGVDCQDIDIPLDDFAPIVLLIGGGLAAFKLGRKKVVKVQ